MKNPYASKWNALECAALVMLAVCLLVDRRPWESRMTWSGRRSGSMWC